MTSAHVRNILVVMSFGGDDALEERRSILEFLRLKYIIENKVSALENRLDKNSKMLFKVNVFKAQAGMIIEKAIRQIREADVLIALVTGSNANVIYELAVRCLFRVETIVIVKGDPKKVLPLYLQDMAFINWAQYDRSDGEKKLSQDGQRIQDEIDGIAKSSLNLNFQDDDIPDSLKDAVDKFDDYVTDEIKRALETVEGEPPPDPLPFLQDLLADVSPARALSKWDSYIPYSVWEILWHGQTSPYEYLPEDLDGPPVLSYANQAYFELFSFLGPTGSEIGQMYSSRALSFSRLMKQIKPYISEKNMQAFLTDQDLVQQKVIFEQTFHWPASVPLVFNDKHPSGNVRGRGFMPFLIARRVIGDVQRPHSMYLITAMIEGPWANASRDDAGAGQRSSVVPNLS